MRVKGNGTVTIVEEPKIILPVAEKLNLMFFGTLDYMVDKMIIEKRKPKYSKIKPEFIST